MASVEKLTGEGDYDRENPEHFAQPRTTVEAFARDCEEADQSTIRDAITNGNL